MPPAKKQRTAKHCASDALENIPENDPDIDDIPPNSKELLDESDGDYEEADDQSDVQSEDEDVLYSLNTDDEYVSRNGTTWKPYSEFWGKTRTQNLMTGKPGVPLHISSRIRSATDCFDLFITPEIKDVLIKYTNLHGPRLYSDWTCLTLVELDAYFGLLILQGTNNDNLHPVRELWSKAEGRPLYRAVMARERFQQISVSLRFDDPVSRHLFVGTDKLAHIRNVLNLWVPLLSACYMPGEDVTVDEQLLPLKGRCSFKQYMPNKPRSKYGIKIWMLCCAITGYCLMYQIYVGKNGTQPAQGSLGERVVMDMVAPLGNNSGRNVYMDNFFTSLPLAKALWERNLTLVGTIRKNKADIPAEFLPNKQRELYSSMFGFNDQHTIVSYVSHARKAVILLSTLHHDCATADESEQSKETEKKKPQIILDYKKGKAGVDLLDQMIGNDTLKRKCYRWTMAAFQGILDVSLHNSYVIWTNLNPGWHAALSNRRRMFLRDIGYGLIKSQLLARLNVPTLQIDVRNHVRDVLDFLKVPAPHNLINQANGMGKLDVRKRCKPCYNLDKKNNKTATVCPACTTPICGKHSVSFCQLCCHKNLERPLDSG